MSTMVAEGNEHVAPIRGWRKVAIDSLWVGGSTLGSQALAVVSSLAFRALLDPAQIGIWQGLKLVLEYGNYASFGVSKGATRELTIALGRGDRAAAGRLANLGFTFNLLTSAGFSLVLLLAALVILWAGVTEYPRVWAGGLAVMALLALLQRHVSFQITLLRAQQEFHSTSIVNLLEAGCMLAVGVLAVALFGLPGLYIATAATMGISLAVLVARGAGRFHWHWNPPEIRRLAAIGLPILLVGVGTTFTRSLDRWLILGLSPNREVELGLYSVALLVTTQLAGVANILAIVMGPRYGELLGSSGQRRIVARLAARITELTAGVMLLPGLAAITLGPSLLALLLPGYEAGLAAMVVRVPGAVARALAIPANQHLITVDQQRRALLTLLPAAILAYAGIALSYRYEWGLIGVAWAMTASDLAYLAIVSIAAFAGRLDARASARYALAIFAGIVPLLALALWRPAHELTRPVWDRDFILCAIAVLGWFALAAGAWHAGGWRSLARKEIACEG